MDQSVLCSRGYAPPVNRRPGRRDRHRYRLEAGRVRFEREVRLLHRRAKQSIPRFLRESSILNLFTAPIIYSVIVPIGLLDVWITLYQAVCFRAYGIARV